MCHLCRLYRLFHCRAEKYLCWWDWRELSDIDHGNTSLSSDGSARPIRLGGAGSCQVVEVAVLGGIIISRIIDSSRTPCKGIMDYCQHHFGLLLTMVWRYPVPHIHWPHFQTSQWMGRHTGLHWCFRSHSRRRSDSWGRCQRLWHTKLERKICNKERLSIISEYLQ